MKQILEEFAKQNQFGINHTSKDQIINLALYNNTNN